MTEQPRAGMFTPDGKHHRGDFAAAVRQHFPWLDECAEQRKQRGPTPTISDIVRQDPDKQSGPR